MDATSSTSTPPRRFRLVLWLILGLVSIDCVIARTHSTWDRYSPDDYAERVNACATQRRDFVVVGGSPVSEGVDPSQVTGAQWQGQTLRDGFAVGLPGGTTSDVYYASLRSCATPPKVLIYGIAASDINDARHEPHGAHSLLTVSDWLEWVRLRPDSANWITRHYWKGQLQQLWQAHHFQHGIRMWAADTFEQHFPGSCPDAAKEAREKLAYTDAMRHNRGYAPASWFENSRYDYLKAEGWVAPTFAYLDKFHTGSHLKYLHKLADWCKEHGTTLIVVEMPITLDLDNRHAWEQAEFRKRLLEFEASRNVAVWSGHRDHVGLTDEHFADLTHLNRAGAAKFSRWLGTRLTAGDGPNVIVNEIPKLEPQTPVTPFKPMTATPKVKAPEQLIFASQWFFIFLAVVLTGYHSLGRRSHKYVLLLVASWFFYAWISPKYLWVILLLTFIDYVVGLKIAGSDDRRIRRVWLTFSIISNLSLLFAFKYVCFAYDALLPVGELLGLQITHRTWDILLPLGISYHTFQGISYTVDVYRREIDAVRNPIDYAMFVTFFPQLAAGPIVRAIEFLPQMITPPSVSARQIVDGVSLFSWGLFKKLVIADHLDMLIVSPAFEDPSQFSGNVLCWATVAWAVQIYCDFSGYTDMARGTAKFVGFELPINFNLPYLATSITDFWRRWHLSLSTWLRDYLYFPLGGSQGSTVRTYFNLMLIFILCGLWHGAAWNWLVYGMANGLLMSIHRIYERSSRHSRWITALRQQQAWKFLAWAGTAYQFVMLLILIRMPSWENGEQIAKAMLGLGSDSVMSTELPTLVPVLIVAGLLGHVGGWFQERGIVAKPFLLEPLRLFAAALAIVGVLVLGAGVTQSFIYIQF